MNPNFLLFDQIHKYLAKWFEKNNTNQKKKKMQIWIFLIFEKKCQKKEICKRFWQFESYVLECHQLKKNMILAVRQLLLLQIQNY